eukprot:gene3559-13631_t
MARVLMFLATLSLLLARSAKADCDSGIEEGPTAWRFCDYLLTLSNEERCKAESKARATVYDAIDAVCSSPEVEGTGPQQEPPRGRASTAPAPKRPAAGPTGPNRDRPSRPGVVCPPPPDGQRASHNPGRPPSGNRARPQVAAARRDRSARADAEYTKCSPANGGMRSFLVPEGWTLVSMTDLETEDDVALPFMAIIMSTASNQMHVLFRGAMTAAEWDICLEQLWPVVEEALEAHVSDGERLPVVSVGGINLGGAIGTLISQAIQDWKVRNSVNYMQVGANFFATPKVGDSTYVANYDINVNQRNILFEHDPIPTIPCYPLVTCNATEVDYPEEMESPKMMESPNMMDSPDTMMSPDMMETPTYPGLPTMLSTPTYPAMPTMTTMQPEMPTMTTMQPEMPTMTTMQPEMPTMTTMQPDMPTMTTMQPEMLTMSPAMEVSPTMMNDDEMDMGGMMGDR